MVIFHKEVVFVALWALQNLPLSPQGEKGDSYLHGGRAACLSSASGVEHLPPRGGIQNHSGGLPRSLLLWLKWYMYVFVGVKGAFSVLQVMDGRPTVGLLE